MHQNQNGKRETSIWRGHVNGRNHFLNGKIPNRAIHEEKVLKGALHAWIERAWNGLLWYTLMFHFLIRVCLCI